MDPRHKSVAVDRETWEVLQVWADQEFRSVNSQISWLVNKHLPANLRKINKQSNIDKQPYIDKQPAQPVEIELNPWTTSPVKIRSRRLSSKSQLFLVINSLSEMNEPLTNFELANLIPELTQKQVNKRTSYAFDTGLLTRQATGNSQPGRFLYQLTKAGKRHINRAV